MFSEDVTSRQEAGAAADAEASAPDHDVAVLGAAARSNATPPPDGASEERLCNQSLAIKYDQRSATKFKFVDRISAIKYLLELNYLTHGPDDRLIRNHTKPRDVHLPFIEGNPKVGIYTVIRWHKKSLPTEEDWEGMRADPDLEKELGEDWFFARCYPPRTWIHKLNQRRSAAGLLVKGVPGRKRHVDNYPELDEKHYDRRVRRTREADTEGCQQTLADLAESLPSPLSPGRITSAQALRLAQSARSSPLSRCAENIDSALSIAAQRRRVYSHAARAEEARLLAGTESPVSPLTRRLYEHLKAGRARPDSVDYLPPKFKYAKNNEWNPEYSSLQSLRRHARADKLGPRSSSSTKASSTTFESTVFQNVENHEIKDVYQKPKTIKRNNLLRKNNTGGKIITVSI